MILSIDQSLCSTGAVLLFTSGTFFTYKITTKSSTPWLERMTYIINELEAFVSKTVAFCKEQETLEAVVLEQYAFAGSFKGFVLGELGGIIKFHFGTKGYKVHQLIAAHHKMYIANNGHAEKKDTIKGLSDKYGIEIKSDDIADAMAMAILYRDLLKYESGELMPDKYDTIVLKRVRSYLNGDFATKKRKARVGTKKRRSSRTPAPSTDNDPFTTV